MTDTPTSADTADIATSDSITANVTSTGGASQTSNYDIPPEHQHHADAIMAMDPHKGPTPHVIPPGWQANIKLRASALSPEAARIVREQVDALGDMSDRERADAEAQITAQTARSLYVGRRNVGSGVPDTPFHHELANQAYRYRDIEREWDQLEAELTRVARHDTHTDPVTGVQTAIPVFAVTGTRRTAMEQEQRRLVSQGRLLVRADGTLGVEGARQLKKAMHAAVMQRVAQTQQLEEAAEAKRRAEAINREKRINERAESLARMSR